MWKDHYSLIIRAALPIDADAIDQLVRRVALTRPWVAASAAVHRLSGDGMRIRTVLDIDGSILGVATLYERDLHPFNCKMAVLIDPDRVNAGACTRLLETCLRQSNQNDHRPVLLATREDDEIPLHAAAGIDFTPLMRTHHGTIDLAGHRTMFTPSFPDDLTLVTLTDMPDDAVRFHLAAAHARIYREAHIWNPARTLSPAEALDLFLHPDDTLPAWTFGLVDDREIAGIASLRPTDPGADAELGWIGVLPPNRSDRDVLIPALLATCLTAARSAGAMTIRYEIDANETELWRALQSFPRTSDPDWVTLRRD